MADDGGGRRRRAYIGSFTAAGGLGVLTAAVDEESGALTLLGAVNSVADPRISPCRRPGTCSTR